MSAPDTYEIFAVKYGEMAERYRHHNFIVADDHDALMPMDYFVWALVNKERTIVVDTGFSPEEGALRGRTGLRRPAEGLAMVGIDAAKVEQVIITHLHYDHAGTLEDFPSARFHINDLEMQFTTGRLMRHGPFRHSFRLDDILNMVRFLYDDRVVFHLGAEEIAPGVTVHHIGGHTMGLQSVRVKTRRGWVVLASDAVHYFENMDAKLPFPIIYNLGDMIEGWETLRRLADSPDHLVPGHDPLVLARYPAADPELEGVVAKLDLPPR